MTEQFFLLHERLKIYVVQGRWAAAWTGDSSEVNLQDHKPTVTALVIIARTAQK